MKNPITKTGQAATLRADELGRETMPETSIEGPKKIGFMMLFSVFGLFGLWATFAPISGAVLAPGQVAVKLLR